MERKKEYPALRPGVGMVMVAVAIVKLLTAPAIYEVQAKEQPPVIQAATAEVKIAKQETIPPILAKIAWCESRNRQFDDDGSVLRGEINHNDIGVFQINSVIHGATAHKRGFDIYTREGNTNYALYLYRTQGTAPWNWSNPCWGAMSKTL